MRVSTGAFGRLWIWTVVVVWLSAGAALAQTFAPNAPLPPGLERLSTQIAEVQKVLKERFGIEKIYIGGGSARTLLDAVYQGQTFSMRDLDIFAVAGRQVQRGDARKMARAFEALPTGYRHDSLERRLRANPALPQKESNLYSAGYGFFLRRANDPLVVDISVYHTPADLALNGILNIDRIMIPLRSDETLVSAVNRMRGKPYPKLVRSGAVIDRHRGYDAWRHGKLKVLHWSGVAADPELHKVRLARSYAKAGATPPRGVLKRLASFSRGEGRRPRKSIEQRNVERLLNDPEHRAVAGFRMLQQTGSKLLSNPKVVAHPNYAPLADAVSRGPKPVGIMTSIGPGSANPESLEQVLRAGTAFVRLNLAHLNAREARHHTDLVRQVAARLGKEVPILFDLPGGKIRTGPEPAGGSVDLREGGRFTLRYGVRAAPSTAVEATVDYGDLSPYAKVGGKIMLHHQRLELEITGVEPGAIHTRVVRGGKLQGRASVHLVGQDPLFPAMTADDRRKLKIAVANGATHIGVSMVQNVKQLRAVRRALARLGAPRTKIVAKIETLTAMDNLEALTRESDMVMIARGDLGVAVGSKRALNRAEARIATVCRRQNKPFIDATGFLSSLARAQRPTRADVYDVNRAYALAPDYIMLKETAMAPDAQRWVVGLREELGRAERRTLALGKATPAPASPRGSVSPRRWWRGPRAPLVAPVRRARVAH